MKFDHIAVTTTTLAAGRALLADTLNIRDWTQEFEDPVNDVHAQFGRCPSRICYELIAPLSEKSPVCGVLAKKTNVLNHLAYLVDDLGMESARLQASNWVPIATSKPAIAYGGRLIQFFVSPSRLLIELIEAPGHQHVYYTLSANQE